MRRFWVRGHYADYIYPNLTPLPYPTVLIMVRQDPIDAIQRGISGVSPAFGAGDIMAEIGEQCRRRRPDSGMVVDQQGPEAPGATGGLRRAGDGREIAAGRDPRERIEKPGIPRRVADR